MVLTCARWVRSLIGNPGALPKAVLRKFMVDQHYMSSERGKAGMFPLQQVLLDLFFFHHDLVAQFGSEQDWSAS